MRELYGRAEEMRSNRSAGTEGKPRKKRCQSRPPYAPFTYLDGIVRKYFVNPIALGPFQDGLALRVRERRADAPLKKRLENFTLCCPRLLRTRAAAARVLHRQVKRCGTGFVSDRRIGTCVQKTLHGGSTSGAHRAVKGCSPILVLCINIGSRFEQKANHR